MNAQLTLTGLESAYRTLGRKAHGGAHAQGRRKLRRPIHESKPLHLVLRSGKAKGSLSLLSSRNERPVKSIIRSEARRSGVKLIRFVNVGNHIHLVVLPVKRRLLQRFLRVISGKIARAVTGAQKGRAFGRFWDGLTFSRILEWGRDYRNTLSYLVKNEIEALGWGDLVREKKPEKRVLRTYNTKDP